MYCLDPAASQRVRDCHQGFGRDATPTNAGANIDFVYEGIQPAKFHRPPERQDDIPDRRARGSDKVSDAMRNTIQQRRKAVASRFFRLLDTFFGMICGDQ